MLAAADTPLESVKLTTKRFVPMSEFAGVPERTPLVATLNQAGPLTLAKVRGSPAGATVRPFSGAKEGRLATADAAVKGLLVKVGTVRRKIVPFPPPAEAL